MRYAQKRILREIGGDAGGEAAQKRARRFRLSKLAEKTAALAFPPPAGVAPSIGTPPRADDAESAALVRQSAAFKTDARKSAAIERGTFSVD